MAIVAIGRVRDLEIDQDLTFQRRSWIVQRVGWVIMALLLVVALAGGLGSGPLSHRETGIPGLFRVEYQRFSRYQTPETLTVRVEPAGTRSGEVRLWMDRTYLGESKVESITPPPSRVEAAADRLLYAFPVSRAGERAVISFKVQSEQLGLVRSRLGLADAGQDVAFWQLVYP